MTYEATRTQVETYFDRTATRTWERLTSDAPVSRIRETVRLGRDQMRALLLAALPEDLSGARVLDAGCGTGQATQELVERGAHVVAADISPSLISIAQKRLPEHMHSKVQFKAGDMLSDDLGYFDHVVAMDSLIYYGTNDICSALKGLSARTDGSILFSVAPRTPLLMIMWRLGKLFPRSDRSPVMVPHSAAQLAQSAAPDGRIRVLGRVTSGFYISEALEFGS